ncbi:glycosyltransferase family 4 protein [Novosphingobium sp. NBM11]|nr:glycosyltransferase family 4 protein [Novosphingobium sp. NBM11]
MSEMPVPKMKILWASVFSLLDTSSGAAIAIREMMMQLVHRGHEVDILGATVFDHPAGVSRIADSWDEVRARAGQWVNVDDGPLRHRLYVTGETARPLLTSREEGDWHEALLGRLDAFGPDIVFFYGGQTLEMLTAIDAHRAGAGVAAYLGNAQYYGTRWCRDVDLLLTVSEANAALYREREGYEAHSVGVFIDPAAVVAPAPRPERVLFVNPTLDKGAAVVCRMAMLLERRRPDIVFEVVESRGKWEDIVQMVTAAFGEPRDSLSNVVVTPNTADMRPVYGRARCLLMPTLWWESAGRVIVEAMLNGIPAIVSNRGGPPEMLGEGGLRIAFPEACYQPPFTELPSDRFLEQIIEKIVALFDDPGFHGHFSGRARQLAATKHDLRHNTDALEREFAALVARGQGMRKGA